MTNSSSPQASIFGPRTIMTILAHPDDETFAFSGTLAKAAAQGARIICVCATRGEGGDISDLSDASRDTLGQVREAELRAAATIIGAAEVIFLDYIDGTLATVDFDELVGKVVKLVRQYQPDLLISFGPDGVYGHPDHITMSKAALAAWNAAADRTAYPEQLADGTITRHHANRLYYFVFARGNITRQLRRALELGIPRIGWADDLLNEVTATADTRFGNVAAEGATLGLPDEYVNTAIDIRGYGAKKHEAVMSHRTQLHEHLPERFFTPDIYEQAFYLETFARVNPDGSTRHTSRPDEWNTEL